MDISQFQKNGKFLMLALDQRGSFQKMFPNPVAVTDDDIIAAKSDILNALSNEFSGVLLDPEWGLKAYSTNRPYLLSIEKTGYRDDAGDRITELEYTVADLKRLGASGVKLLVYYDHDSASVNTQMETTKRVLTDCNTHGLPLFLEIITYNEVGSKAKQIINAVSMFLDQGIRPHVFKLEYPEEAEYCRTITNYLGATPWILLTKGIDFESFKDNLQIAIENGASGFLAGRSIWQEAVHLNGEERKTFLKTVAVKRFREICQIALEKVT